MLTVDRLGRCNPSEEDPARIALSTLNERKDLPSAVTDSNWLKELEKEDGE